MQIAKVRDETGLVPAGRYFERLTRQLKRPNEQETTRRARLEQQDRASEAMYRRGMRDMHAAL